MMAASEPPNYGGLALASRAIVLPLRSAKASPIALAKVRQTLRSSRCVSASASAQDGSTSGGTGIFAKLLRPLGAFALAVRGVARRARGKVIRHADSEAYCAGREVTKLRHLGKSATEKALQVNLDPTIYGSFAEIGAGQEVSRTFLTAGAAAGTVARSLSAYDMQLSDATYGKASRYVTKERLLQMMNTEYQILEDTIRDVKGPDMRFFAFASTLAAKAYMSNRECEGWVGVTYQHAPGAKPSTVALHVRMGDETAQLQGEAIGVLGTNLLYLCDAVQDPYIIATFLLDGLDVNRLEIDFINFSGPGFPEGCVDYRLLAMRMVQFRVAMSVLLDYDKQTERYVQVVPNTTFYKRSVVVQRSRFRPVTYAHREVMEAGLKQLKSELGKDEKEPLHLLDMQIDDIVRPAGLVGVGGRVSRAQKLVAADLDNDGLLSIDQIRKLLSKKTTEDKLEDLMKVFGVDKSGKIPIDALLSLSSTSLVAKEFLDRFRMLQPLKFPIMVSRLRQDYKLADYLSRYTKAKIVITVGGGKYSIERGFFNPAIYDNDRGGMLEAFGRLFKQDVRIFQFPNIDNNGKLLPPDTLENASTKHLHAYLESEGKIVEIDEQFMTDDVKDPSTNRRFRGQSDDVLTLIKQRNSEWEDFVPPEVAEIVKRRGWYDRLGSEMSPAEIAYEILYQL